MDLQGLPHMARLSHLVPSTGQFFTPLPLERAFVIQDENVRFRLDAWLAPVSMI